MVKETKKLKVEDDKKIFNISYLVLGVLIFLTLGVTYNFYTSAKSKDMVRFGNQVNRLSGSVDNRIKLYTAMLKGGRGFIETKKDLTQENFAVYISSLDLQNRYPGIQGIGYAEYFNTSERENLTNKLKTEGFADFRIYPEGEREKYASIIYLEPSTERNRSAIGFDMFSEEVRREAMERARDTGEASASGKVALVQESGEENPAGFLIYLPIYENGRMPALPEDKEKNLRGFIYSPFLARNFLNEIYTNFPEKDIKISIYDSQIQNEDLLAQTDNNNQQNSIGISNETFVASQEIDVGGRKWILQFTSLPSFAEQSSVSWTPLIFLCGIGFSLLLFGMTYWEAISRSKVQKTAAELFELQKEKEQLFEDEKKMRQIAEQANLTKDEFISIVSHELKTPLNAIAGWTRILKTEDVSKQTKELALQKIDKNLRTQAKLVEQLLNYSEIISGRVNLIEEKIDFSDVFDQSCDDMKHFADEKRIEFVKNNQLNKQIIVGDREKLKLAIENLLSNAVKFTQSGGHIEATIKESENCVELCIKDNGRGISPDFLPHIFEHYKQADTPNTRDYGGLGLGLTIAKHIIKLHKGTISAESAGKNRGTVFTVKIPTQ